MNKDIVIWGSGRMGNAAYFYYKDVCNICGYVDNDKRKWGRKLNGINIYSPEYLKKVNARIVIAIKGGADDVINQLKNEYEITEYILFQVSDKEYSSADSSNEKEQICENTCIVNLSGGLGNQMFQYAFYKTLQLNGKKVLACLQDDIGTSECHLLRVFRNIDIKMCSENQKKILMKKNMQFNQRSKKFLIYLEESTNEVEVKRADTSIINVTGGVFSGLFQTHTFADRIVEALRKEFQFDRSCEQHLIEIEECFNKHNTVGIHIRRGDYLLGNNVWAYGDICTAEYYRNAMQYIEKRVKDCLFVFFSNDIKWVEKHYKVKNAKYIESGMFNNYRDWYDMYLMSICKHNIIANSTFSWWGAWLNQNKDKIVIAPKKWVNLCDYMDIYPKDWIQI